jgi:hypothetical protein
MRLRGVALLLGVLALTLVFAGSAQAAFTPGSSGLGDPFFPLAGNGGYDASHYGLDLSYEPATNQLTGTATITAPRRRICRGSTSIFVASRSRASTSTGARRPSRATVRS